jgi:hypothetical protein
MIRNCEFIDCGFILIYDYKSAGSSFDFLKAHDGF